MTPLRRSGIITMHVEIGIRDDAIETFKKNPRENRLTSHRNQQVPLENGLLNTFRAMNFNFPRAGTETQALQLQLHPVMSERPALNRTCLRTRNTTVDYGPDRLRHKRGAY